MRVTKSIVFECGNVSLTVLLDDDFEKYGDGVGFFEVFGSKVCWDNLAYFEDLKFKKFKKDLDDEFKGREKEIYKAVKKLLKEAKKKGLL